MPNTGVMASVPKPLIALLVATVAVFALYTAVLKKTLTGGSSSSSPSTPALQSAINQAHQAVAKSNAASVAHGGTVNQAPAAAPKATTTAKATTPSAAKPAAPAKPAPAHRPVAAKPVAQAHRASTTSVNAVIDAINAHKVVALLFYNPAAADDQAVKQELAGVSTEGGRVAKFSVPVTQLAQYQAVTTKVPVTTSPTLIVIDRQGQATTLTGYVDQPAIAQQVADALAAK